MKTKSNFWYAWFFLLALLAIQFFSGCITREKCNERFPPQVKDSIYTSVKDSIVFVPDTIYLEPERIMFHDSIPCPHLNYHRTEKQGNLTETVDIRNGVITEICKEDSLKKIIMHKDHIISDFTSRSKTEVHTIINEVTPWIARACEWWTGISLLLLLLFFGYKFVRSKIP